MKFLEQYPITARVVALLSVLIEGGLLGVGTFFTVFMVISYLGIFVGTIISTAIAFIYVFGKYIDSKI